MMPVTHADHILGNEHAPVTLVEYGDFECPNCKQAAPAVKLLLERYTERVRFAFRHFPLEDVHPHALTAAQAAECAGGQGKFWEMHDLLYENQKHLQVQDLAVYAERLGLQADRFTTELAERTHLERVREDFMSGVRSGVNGTPTFFINGRRHDGSYEIETLLGALERASSKET